MKSFIKMLSAVTNPVAIERGYQIFAAKRDLLARQSEKTVKFAHSYMEPRPLETKCPDMVDLHHVTTTAKPADTAVAGEYKLIPSFADYLKYDTTKGQFVLRLRNVTPAMVESGFYRNQCFKLITAGYERSHVRKVNSHKKAIVKNQYLESAFRFHCGCFDECCCSARN